MALITDSQLTFLRRLLDESFAHGKGTSGTNLDRHHLNQVSKKEASEAIATLLAAKKDNWGNTTVFSKTTRRCIGTVSRHGDGIHFGAYSYKIRAGETFSSHADAVAWVEGNE